MSKVKVIKKSEKYDELKNESLRMFYRIVEDIIIRNLTGEILTIIDSSVTDKQQNKAIKDLIKSRIRYWVGHLQKSASKNAGWGNSINFPEEKH